MTKFFHRYHKFLVMHILTVLFFCHVFAVLQMGYHWIVLRILVLQKDNKWSSSPWIRNRGRLHVSSGFCCDVKKSLTLFIYTGRADWAHWRVISNTLLFTRTATHVDAEALSDPDSRRLSIWRSVAYCSGPSRRHLLKEGNALLIHFPQVRLCFRSSAEQECHDSALGPVHSFSCDDVTDGIFPLISHNKGKVMPKCIAATGALIAQLVYSAFKQSFGEPWESATNRHGMIWLRGSDHTTVLAPRKHEM